jgi:electron transport complex protein RnfB
VSSIGVAVAILGGLTLLFGAVLAAAHRLLAVEVDPLLAEVIDLLPGNNCGACGQPGCAAFGGKLVAGEQEPGACTVADEGTLVQIASRLGVDVGGGDRRIARLRCAGGEGLVGSLADYRGESSCRAAMAAGGGGRACTWGCLGLADCEVACDFDAIAMGADGLPYVDPDLCTACGDCVDACPLDLFVLEPRAQRLFVRCASELTGEAARDRCSVACDACGRCALDAPANVITMKRGLPVIDWTGESPGPEAAQRCPTGAIAWMTEGEAGIRPPPGDTNA